MNKAMRFHKLATLLFAVLANAAVAMTWDTADRQPMVQDLTCYGTSSAFGVNSWLNNVTTNETQNAVFTPTAPARGASPSARA